MSKNLKIDSSIGGSKTCNYLKTAFLTKQHSQKYKVISNLNDKKRSRGNPLEEISLKKTELVLNSLTVCYFNLDHNNTIV